MESWTTLMYNFMDSNNLYIAIFFFIFMVLFGAFFTMQLVLAEIIESYERESARKEEELRLAVIAAEEDQRRKDKEEKK